MRSSLSLAFCLLLAGAAEAQDLNVITGVEVKDEGGSVLVTVKGSKPPNFTTFSMADPARFVIDLSESKFQGVPEDMRIDDGVIRVVKNLAYGSGATAIARVMLAFTADVEPPDVQTEGTSLLVRVAKPGGAAVAAAGGKPPGAAGGPGTSADAAAKAAAKADADEAARKEALAREQRDADAREQARVAAEASAKEREAQARAEADARTREAERVAAEKAAAEEAARVAADARRAEIKAKVAADEGQSQKKQPAAAPSQAESEVSAQAKADTDARREIEEALAAQQAAAPPQAPAPAPAPTPVPAAAPPPAVARTPAPATAMVQAPAPAPTPAPAPARAQGSASISSLSPAGADKPARPAKLQAVGFQQLPTVSRVFVKTNATPHFTITDVGDDVVRLEVENTRASRRNDTRPLDTSFFHSAVAMITPSKQGSSYVVDIKLRKRVPYQQKVEGDVLAIDFERPPAPAGTDEAATPGAASAPGEATPENEQGLVLTPDGKAEDAEPAGDAEPATEPAPKK